MLTMTWKRRYCSYCACWKIGRDCSDRTGCVTAGGLVKWQGSCEVSGVLVKFCVDWRDRRLKFRCVGFFDFFLYTGN